MSYAQNEESLDIILCYQALGVRITDPPQRVDETYERLVRRCKAEFKSEDAMVRETAREQLLALERMYDSIRTSVSYASSANEQKKAGSGASRAVTTCPSCNARISEGIHSCPFCKASLLSTWQKLKRKFFGR